MSPDVRRPIDRLLLFFALALMAVGMVWVFSASAFKNHSAAATFLVNQLVGGFVGVAIMLALSQTDLLVIKENPRALQVLYVLILLLLVAVFFFPAKNHAHRWMRYGRASLQPSELFKPLAVLITAWWMVRHRDVWNKGRESVPKLVTLFAIMVVPLALILREPDFGTTFLILSVVLLVTFLGGAASWIFAVAAPALGAVGFAFVWFEPYRRARVLSFLNPEADPLGKGHQALQSLIAVGNGGITGVGLGASMQKLNYLPEAHTDFIYAVISEEAGLIGSVLVLALFVGILWRGYRVARRVRDSFLKLCAMGFTLLLVLQALMNLSVVLSLAPNKGIPLPFISYGTSSLVASLASLGLLLAISKEASE
ncbi:putative lipid II flippase FtsW [Mesoterricola sediminis]|uniref:Probable peptidoglycan glycosyltransferase FtsW n=1 Tax=Mesoterricola sediminis TaxID=2927980 RepID=A0AA48GT18_9BACT|nr:putative lipid II flippase FtsW [Mesoterricola sediminis]BDU77067.1 stage V sporulation protein E [Mesoterricola sediminis]